MVEDNSSMGFRFGHKISGNGADHRAYREGSAAYVTAHGIGWAESIGLSRLEQVFSVKLVNHEGA